MDSKTSAPPAHAHPIATSLLSLTLGAGALAAIVVCGANSGAVIGAVIAATGLWKPRL